MHADHEGLGAHQGHVGFLQLHAARADGLHLPAFEHQPRFVALLDEIVVEGLLVFDDRHKLFILPFAPIPTVHKSVIVPRTARAMFDLVDDVERYPQFLPWCSAAQVFERSESITRARIDIDYHGLASHFSTLNRKEAPRRMDLEFVEGPFEAFKGRWTFVPLGEAGCRVEFALDYTFSHAAAAALLGPVFGHIIETLVDRFVARAEALA